MKRQRNRKSRVGLVAVLSATAMAFAPVAMAAPGGGGHGGGGGEETALGNNLAVPVIWGEPAGEAPRPVLRGTGPQTQELLVDTPETHVVLDGLDLFLQKTENTWQSENADAAALVAGGLTLTSEGRVPITYVDWGDNLEARDPSGKQVRVETTLRQDVSGISDIAPADPAAPAGMTGYAMTKVSGQGVDEVWGVQATQSAAWTATPAQALEAVVYTGLACLTIERIDNAAALTWDATTRTWSGNSVINTCIGDVVDGPGGYGSEVTVSGGMTNGYVWPVKGLPQGLYRLTYSTLPGTGVDFTDETAVYESAESEESTETTADESGEPAGNTPVIDPVRDLSYLDVGIGVDRTKPTRPLALTGTAGQESAVLAWEPPASPGTTPIKEYVVTGTGAGAVTPEKRIAADQPLRAVYDDLSADQLYEFTVAAVNDSGAGDAASVKVTPTPPPVTPVTPPPVTPGTGGPVEPLQAKSRSKVSLHARVHNSAKRNVRSFGTTWTKAPKGEWEQARLQVKLWFDPRGKADARVIKTVTSGAKNGYSLNFRVRNAGRVYAQVKAAPGMSGDMSRIIRIMPAS